MERVRALLLLATLLISTGTGCASGAGPDPWEGMNRKTHGFNEGLDIMILEPVAKGWDWLLPEVVESSLTKFFENLAVPLSFVNNVLMLRGRAAVEDASRFALNTTWGIAGLFDPATQLELPNHQADFGLTLARWSVPTGPYFVIPVFGPSNVRDTVGLAGDIAMYTAAFLPLYVTIPARAVETINLRAQFLEEIADSRRSSFDYYVFIRNAYLQNRQSKVDKVLPRSSDAPEDDGFYYYDEEE